MGFLDHTVADVIEPKPVEEGEYLIEVTRAEVVDRRPKEGEEESPGQMLRLRFRHAEVKHATRLTDWFVFPCEGDDEDVVEMKLLKLKRFQTAFDCDIDAMDDSEELVGMTGRAWVVQEDAPDQPEGVRNNIAGYPQAA